MGAAMKHKILTIALLFSATSALAQTSGFHTMAATFTASCTDCLIGTNTDPFNGQVARPQKITIFSANGKDPRYYQPRAKNKFAATGVGENINNITVTDDDGSSETGKGQGTINLISPCLAITDYHVVFGDAVPTNDFKDLDRGPKHYAMNISVGDTPSGSGFKYSNIRATPIFWGNSSRANHNSQDWVILALDPKQCAGNDPQVSFYGIDAASQNTLSSENISTVGYPADKEDLSRAISTKKLIRVDNCHFYGNVPNSDLFTTDCSATPGSSGSAMFVTGVSKPNILGLMDSVFGKAKTIQRQFTPEFMNAAISMGVIEEEFTAKYGGRLDNVINADIKRNGDKGVDTEAPAVPITSA